MKKIFTLLIVFLFFSKLFSQDYTSSDNIRFDITLQSDSIIYVDDDNTTGPWTGTFQYPFQNIPEGLAEADTNVSVVVLPGNYLITQDLIVDSSVTLFLDTNVICNFNFAFGLEIHGRIKANGMLSDSVIFTSTHSDSTWKGFRFINGDDGSEFRYGKIENCSGWDGVNGGAVYISNTDVKIINSLIQNNIADYGAGILCDNSSSCEIKNGVFLNNTGLYGAGVSVTGNSSANIGYCTFSDNITANDGSAIYGDYAGIIVLDNCDILRNTSAGNGGGLAANNTETLISYNNFENNNAGFGGAVYLYDSDESSIVWNVFDNNSGNFNGGALYIQASNLLSVSRNLYLNNSANRGAGVYLMSTNSDFSNNTLFNNFSTNEGGGIFSNGGNNNVVNNIFWDNSSSDSSQISGTGLNVTYNDVDGGFAGVGNFEEYPNFADTASGNFKLHFLSSCINTGDPNSPKDPDSSYADVGVFYYHVNTQQILLQPVDYTIINGEDAVFNLIASGATAYQWQESTDGGNFWADLVESSTYAGVYTNQLNIYSATLSMDGNLYRCVVIGIGPPDIMSDVAMLKVYPVITTTAGSETFCDEINFSIPVSLNSTETIDVSTFSLVLDFDTLHLDYNGYHNINPKLFSGLFIAYANENKIYMSWVSDDPIFIDNDTLFNLKFISDEGVSALVWDTSVPGNCEYINAEGFVYDVNYVNGTIFSNHSPQITIHPSDSSITETENASFYIIANGTSLFYQWQESDDEGLNWNNLSNSPPFSGVTTDQLNITNAPLSLDSNQYRCVVSGICPPQVISNPATLYVDPLPPPPQVITTTAGSVTTCEDNIVIPVSVADCDSVGAISLTLEYDSLVLEYNSYQNVHSELSTGIFIVNSTGNEVKISWASTTVANIGNDTLLELTFFANSGVSNLVWDTFTSGNCEYSDAYGNVILSDYFDGLVTIYELPSVTSQPLDDTITEGENAGFAITAIGTNLNYQWQESIDGGNFWNDLSDTYPYSGVTTNQLTITNAPLLMDGYSYRCYIYGTCPPADTSNSATLYVNPAPPPPQVITTIAATISGCTGNLVYPVNVLDCDSVGAFSLTLIYDTILLDFSGYQNAHSELSTGIMVVNSYNGKIMITWASTVPANIGDDLLMELLFDAGTGTANMTWDTFIPGNCEYSDYYGNIILSNYTNGSVTTAVCNTLLDLTVMLEGPFNGTGMNTDINGLLPLSQPYNTAPWNYTGTESVASIPNNNVVDWILVELRETAGDSSTATSATMIARQAVFVLNNGAITGMDGSNMPQFNVTISQNLFIVIWQRNHLGIMSASPVQLDGGNYTYNFTTSSEQVYGGASGHKDLGGGVWGMIAGDGNSDGEVDINDKNDPWSIQAGASGYLNGDFDLNSEVNNIDKNDIWMPNIGRGSQVQE